MMTVKEEHKHKICNQNEYDEQELGQPVGLICLSNEMCRIVCSFCEDVKGFNEIFSLIYHIKNCHSSTINSNIYSEFDIEIKEEFIPENFRECQGVLSTSKTDKKLIDLDEPSSDLEDYEQNCTTKFPKQNLFKCGKNFNESFNEVQIQEKQFYCNYCKLSFHLEKDLLKHTCKPDTRVLKKKKKQIFHCELCPAALSSKRNLDLHLQRHVGVTTHNCQYCPDSFYRSTDLKNHLVIHTGELKYKCKDCDKSFAKSGSLWKHRKDKHREKPIKLEQKEKNCYKCEECGKSYLTLRYLSSHILSHTVKKRYKCSFCALEFHKSVLLKNHMVKHTGKRFKCEYENCDRSYSFKSSLVAHFRSHTAEKPFKCELCSVVFSTSDSLRIHMFQHVEKRYKCEYENCSKSYLTLRNLRSHIRIHTGEKPFKCTFCSCEFHKKVLLKNHMVKHTGERFKCEYEDCGRSYLFKASLNSHMKTHTGETHQKCLLSSELGKQSPKSNKSKNSGNI